MRNALVFYLAAMNNIQLRLIICLLWILPTGCFTENAACQDTLFRFEFRRPAMGTLFRIVCYSADSLDAARAASSAFDEIDSLEKKFSDYLTDSELNRLSAQAGTGQKIKISAELWEVLRLANQISRRSKGAFDVTIGPLSKLWRRAFRLGEFPEMKWILEARSKVNWRWIRFHPGRRVKLRHAGMRLDLGGIAKGYSLEKARDVLRKHHIHSAMIDGGGDLIFGDPPPGQIGWEVQFPDGAILLSNNSMATSGDHFRFLEWEGKRYSHLIDPRTGLGVSHGLTVTITGPSGALADALASGCSILGPEASARFMRGFPGCSVSFRQK